MGVKSFMAEQKIVDRWFVLRVGIYGGFCGALLAVGFLTSIGLVWP